MSIPLNQCKHGYLYYISSRNLSLGVFRRDSRGFIGVRSKFGDEFLFEEYHHDVGPPFGTVVPKEELEKCPLDDIRESKGMICANCNKPISYTDRGPGAMSVEGRYQHDEISDCKKILPCSPDNQELFDYLKDAYNRFEIDRRALKKDIENKVKGCHKKWFGKHEDLWEEYKKTVGEGNYHEN